MIWKPKSHTCGRSLMKISNSSTKKKKMQNYVILVFFRKKFISKDMKDMKAINYKMRAMNRLVYSSKGSPRDLQLSRTCLTSTKGTSNMKKINNYFSFFCEKPVSKPVNS